MNIKNYRLKVGLTQAELAERMGVHQTAIAQWEKGQAAPTASKLPLLATVLSCSISDLFDDSKEAENEPIFKHKK